MVIKIKLESNTYSICLFPKQRFETEHLNYIVKTQSCYTRTFHTLDTKTL